MAVSALPDPPVPHSSIQSLNDRFRSLLPVLAALPGLIAVGLALLYAVGASLLIVQLAEADLRVAEVLTFIPLEQILARGIGTVLVAGVVVPLLVLGFLMSVLEERRLERHRRVQRRETAAAKTKLSDLELQLAGKPPMGGRTGDELRRVIDDAVTAERQRTRELLRLRRLLVLALLLLLTAVTFMPVDVVIALCVSMLPVGYWLFVRRGRRPRLVVLYLVAMTMSLISAIGLAFIRPQPLSLATIDLKGRAKDVRGKLIVATPSSFVITTDKHVVRIVVARNVVTTTVMSSERRHARSIFELATGRTPPF